MRRRRWLFGLPVSVLVHAASLVLVVGVASRTSELAPLLVDLTLDDAPERRRDEPMDARRRGPLRVTASASGQQGGRIPARAAPGGVGRDRAAWGHAGDDPAQSGGFALPPAPAQVAPRSSAGEAPVLPDAPAYPVPGPALLSPPVPAPPPAVAPAPPAPPEVARRTLHSAPERAQSALPAAAAAAASRPRTESEAPGLRGAAGGAGRSPSASTDPGTGGGGERGGEGVGTGGGARGEGGAGGAALSSRGPGERNGAEYGAYLRLWRTRIHEGLSYPLAARRRNLTGTVHIEIAIEANGALSEVRVIESSSHPLLDDAAVESVRNLAPIPFPPELTPRPLRARLPVVFDLR